MSMIYIFGFDSCYPDGGTNDAIALVDNSKGDKVDKDGWLRSEILAEALSRVTIRPDDLEVLHLDNRGAPAFIENWTRIKPNFVVDPQGSALSDTLISTGLYRYARYHKREALPLPVIG